jgi:VWFA-related protein
MRRRGLRISKLLLLPLTILALAASAQDFKIRAKVDLVEVPVTVKGSGETFVTGLKKNDFVVLEDGRQQVISNFTVDPVPLSAAVIVDTGLGAGSLSKLQKTLTALSGAFSEFDEVAVYRYDKFVTKMLDFSKDPEAILTGLNTLRNAQPNTVLDESIPRGPFSTPGPVINGWPVVPPGQVGVIVTSPPKTSKVLHDAIFTAAAELGQRERNRRRIVVVVSDGDASGSEHSFDQAVQALLERGIQVFAIGLDQPFPHNKFSVLEDYAKNTGGDVYFASSVHEIENAYSTATEGARNQYVLGYISSNEVAGAGPVFRTIEVETRRGKLKVLHRKGYYQYP